ncbi:hypothetical protein SLS61_008208 [Didymella pomorum]
MLVKWLGEYASLSDSTHEDDNPHEDDSIIEDDSAIENGNASEDNKATGTTVQSACGLPRWLSINKESLDARTDSVRRCGEWVFWWNMLDGMEAEVSQVLSPIHARSLTIKSRMSSVYSNMSWITCRDLEWALSTLHTRGDVAPRLSLKLSPVLQHLMVDLEMWTNARASTLQAPDVRWNLDLTALDPLVVPLQTLTICGTLCAPGEPGVLKARLLATYKTEAIRLREDPQGRE